MRAIEPEHFPWFDYKRYTFSLGLEEDGCAWLSGHTATTYDPAEKTNVVRGSMTEQATTAYTKVGAILDAAGLALTDAHRVVEYVTLAGIESYADAAAVREQVMGERRPAVCTVVVNRLLRPAALLEVEVIAGPAGQSFDGGFAIDDVVYLSTIAGRTPREALDLAEERLAPLGLQIANVAKAVWYTAPGGPSEPVDGAAFTLVYPERLMRDDRVSLDVFATRARTEVVDPWGVEVAPAVRAGRYLFISGQTGSGDGVAAQSESALRRVLEVVGAAGGGPNNLLKTIEYVTAAELPRYREVAGVRDKLLTAPYPASTGAVCEALPGGASILVDATALF